MIGVDTNVLVRYLVQDDPAQSRAATAFIDRLTSDEPGYITQVALVETTWVLSRAYKASREDVADAIEALLRSRELVIENADAAYLALGVYRSSKAEFADALILVGGKQAGCRETVTFDKMAAWEAGVRLLKA